jgi:Na+/phosphate symporter
VADKYGKDKLAQQLLTLDQEVERRQNEISHYRYTLENSQDSVKKSVASDRLYESQVRLKYAQEHLEECLNLAKYWQQKGFDDETARIGIKNQNTTKPEGL